MEGLHWIFTGLVSVLAVAYAVAWQRERQARIEATDRHLVESMRHLNCQAEINDQVKELERRWRLLHRVYQDDMDLTMYLLHGATHNQAQNRLIGTAPEVRRG